MNILFLCSLTSVACTLDAVKTESKNPQATSERLRGTIRKLNGNAKLRAYEERELPNGLKLILVNDVSLPYVSFSISFTV